MDITTNGEWQEVGTDYRLQFAQTDDPRVVAVIERDGEGRTMAEHLDGDAIPPVIYVEHVHGLRFTHQAGRDGGEAELMQRAYDEWGWDGTARRWLWIFHGIAADNAPGGYDRSGNWIVATSHDFEDEVGADHPATYDEAVEGLKQVIEEVTSILNGDVFGVGWAVNEGRVLDDEVIDLEDGNWEVEIECWGFVGEEYAQSTAATFDYGTPDLEEMLDLRDEPGFVDHSDRMAQSAAEGW